ncbi:hypothetical protein POW16_30290, partial [Raoultella planticola]|uniref:hypothetical protein n=1 Tax=Raoultella planticola TaxID=575 RepID=UPI002FF5FE8A
RCHRQNMKTSIINGSEVSRLSVAIQSEGRQHYGFAQLSDGTTKDITVTEQSDGKIVVYIE